MSFLAKIPVGVVGINFIGLDKFRLIAQECFVFFGLFDKFGACLEVIPWDCILIKESIFSQREVAFCPKCHFCSLFSADNGSDLRLGNAYHSIFTSSAILWIHFSWLFIEGVDHPKCSLFSLRQGKFLPSWLSHSLHRVKVSWDTIPSVANRFSECVLRLLFLLSLRQIAVVCHFTISTRLDRHLISQPFIK